VGRRRRGAPRAGRELISVAPTASARLSRAIAVAEASGAWAGLAALEGIPPDHRWHAVRAELLAREGRLAEAVGEADASREGELTEPERRYRERRRAEWASGVS
jgi:RNA polymerase sigma-70 factor (ECF subfamily)